MIDFLTCVVKGAVCPAPGAVLIQQRRWEGNQLTHVQRPSSHRGGDGDFPLSHR